MLTGIPEGTHSNDARGGKVVLSNSLGSSFSPDSEQNPQLILWFPNGSVPLPEKEDEIEAESRSEEDGGEES
ncbi:hypothetical protein NQZ68_027978 [Dissostichus eleginoides]|nr:hypothetical protein NQZ68_027978 [Dissostichus eleginoides]